MLLKLTKICGFICVFLSVSGLTYAQSSAIPEEIKKAATIKVPEDWLWITKRKYEAATGGAFVCVKPGGKSVLAIQVTPHVYASLGQDAVKIFANSVRDGYVKGKTKSGGVGSVSPLMEAAQPFANTWTFEDFSPAASNLRASYVKSYILSCPRTVVVNCISDSQEGLRQLADIVESITTPQ